MFEEHIDISLFLYFLMFSALPGIFYAAGFESNSFLPAPTAAAAASVRCLGLVSPAGTSKYMCFGPSSLSARQFFSPFLNIGLQFMLVDVERSTRGNNRQHQQ